MCYEEDKNTAEYACTSYDFILPYFTLFTGEQFASEIEAHFGLNQRTQAVIDAVKSLVTKIYRTPAGVKYAIKKQLVMRTIEDYLATLSPMQQGTLGMLNELSIR